MRVSKLTLFACILFPTIALAQASGTPQQLRVNVDVFGNLVVASSSQTAPLTTTTFSNARLRVDANGNLVVALNGPSLFPDGTNLAPSVAFASQSGLGIYRKASDQMAFMVPAYSTSSSVFGVSSSVNLGSSTIFGWSSTGDAFGGLDTSLTRTAAGTIQLAGTTPMILFGGATSGFPAIKRTGSSVSLRFADDSGNADLGMKSLFVGTTSAVLLLSAANPTISSGFGTSPAVTATNGSSNFIVNVGTGGTASSGVIGLATANNGWSCTVNMEAVVPTTLTKQSASSTTSVTLTNYTVATGATAAWAASTILTVKCMAR